MDLSHYKKEYQELVQKCLAHKEIHILKEDITNIGGMIEPVTFNKGMIIQITGNGKNQIEKIQTATKKYSEREGKGFSDSDLCQRCADLFKAIRDKEITKEIILNEIGALIVINCNLKDWKDIHLLGDCDWCVCPAGTVHSCIKCCGA